MPLSYTLGSFLTNRLVLSHRVAGMENEEGRRRGNDPPAPRQTIRSLPSRLFHPPIPTDVGQAAQFHFFKTIELWSRFANDTAFHANASAVRGVSRVQTPRGRTWPERGALVIFCPNL